MGKSDLHFLGIGIRNIGSALIQYGSEVSDAALSGRIPTSDDLENLRLDLRKEAEKLAEAIEQVALEGITLARFEKKED